MNGHEGFQTRTSFSKPGFGFGQVKPGFGFGFWIFTNENGEADDRIEENFTENAFMEGITVVLRNNTDRRLYIR